MKVTQVSVQSVDGKTTQGTNPDIYSWTSPEDQEHFFELIKHASLIIMGRKTYEVAKPMMKHIKGRLRVVATSTPETFKKEQIPGQLEFTSQKPTQLIQQLEKQGYTEALLVGGATLNTQFFKDGLVNELQVTIEPLVFGEGNHLTDNSNVHVKLELLKVEKLNKKGSLLLTYKVK